MTQYCSLSISHLTITGLIAVLATTAAYSCDATITAGGRPVSPPAAPVVAAATGGASAESTMMADLRVEVSTALSEIGRLRAELAIVRATAERAERIAVAVREQQAEDIKRVDEHLRTLHGNTRAVVSVLQRKHIIRMGR
ncbi:MAG TPA: hypothetical protein VJJ83_01455 [Candidatus Babeliales bacterium]|nr:hypothetical protein [Candidatus Babeliales bacterium]